MKQLGSKLGISLKPEANKFRRTQAKPKIQKQSKTPEVNTENRRERSAGNEGLYGARSWQTKRGTQINTRKVRIIRHR